MINILNLGAGVQSTAVFYMAVFGLIPKFDYIIFADTGWEPDAVYQHLMELHDVALDNGMYIDVVSNGNILQSIRSQAACGNGVHFASMPLFMEGGGLGRRQCTNEFKITPIERKLRDILGLKPRQRWPKEQVIRQHLGISLDETRRLRDPKEPWRSFVYPLCDLESYNDGRVVSLGLKPMRRGECIRWLDSMGVKQPPRSACLGCPFHSNAEWREIRKRPEEWAQVIEVDRLIRQMEGMRERSYLHPSRLAIDKAPIGDDNKNQIGFWDECQGYCGN